ncbi:MAG: helix-turn-helix domain-containing protein [Actinobacteria bacterium]|jgi:DNA-binding IclR family transcriptional regulator|nr:transcriptional regulator [Candidatus Poribacteria bacterium]MBT3246134.1 helix-turn-helix domain-containing protein [Actinomycetota bacterium]MDP7551048.1 helix-turn-helix domain-containing protein [Acidimicrobiales bacterium]MBT3688350.1 helix-turn-helix domain-containing protein [Actinomycetota bacterium]MBT4037248.1 helix-turn-helix domain-containing protein [Actinomycetota bacterium]|tara:strand:- start:2988 stop:3656 length:669 start_codon:yes stop_codon:yes gene_type:complete
MTSSTLHKSRSAERALHLLDTVVTAGSISLGDAARAVDLPTSTALRHLRALEHDGYLDRDPHGMFSVGPTFLRLALTSLREGPAAHLTTAARPHLDRLAETTGESAYLAVRERSRAVYIATAESTRAIRHVGWVGRTVPLSGTAVGTTLTGDGEATVLRNTGGVEPDVAAAVAPVMGPDGTVVAAISVLGPSSRLDDTSTDTVTTAVLVAAEALSRDLRGPT